ncbi:23S rRNA (guanosine2251-2'-O)-methyltransferase [Salsuginibacillus halophilus]|uniref:23S rRNA (Guanosine2251-2'-O)-methyltransferase n=1 Tax=Salsuginibacillus halophilus TaxID=517424 RepID=A0A2P8H503_9BACI|nr:23S rRNA (guanosine(2251)-2'-O)-methyltransferase RlmB [Salsuginibacillus halophilus]PSL41305.1 23S rRNA (guanosine2251-2'-O)-methyltransferase [Salsuginibacillus halophilus]
MSEEWIIGKNAVHEALVGGRPVHKVWIAENTKRQAVQKIVQQSKEVDALIQYVPKKKVDELAGTPQHQGVVASVAAYTYADIDDLFANARDRNEQPFFIVLDGVEDPHNLGSVLRTADAAGAHGVIIPKRRAAGLTQAVAKASTGAVEHVPVARVTNIARTLEDLKEQGLWIAGTDAAGTSDYRELEADTGLGLVIGSEGKGMSRLVREACDFLLTVPMFGQVTSLNASVTASLLMYEVVRKRELKGQK